MFSKLKGIVEEIAGDVVTLDVNGVGYELRCSGGCIAALEPGSKAVIIVYTDVNENAIRLYGFSDALEKQVFLLLTTVKGVGARTSMDIVSQVDKVELLRAIGAQDLQRLQTIKGVGKKTSERIVVELKDRVGEYAMERHESRLTIEKEHSSPAEEACLALESLGFTRKDAEQAVSAVQSHGIAGKVDSAWIVKEALRYI